jgi:inorganic pyrophosphatase
MPQKAHADLVHIADIIRAAARAFLCLEYAIITIAVAGAACILFLLLGVTTHDWTRALLTAVAFVTGAAASMLAGAVGMRIATTSNSATAFAARSSLERAFRVAMRSGFSVGFSVVSIAGIALALLTAAFQVFHCEHTLASGACTRMMFDCVAGFGFGGSYVALFARVGGGIFTKAADIAADSCKADFNFKEDCPKNPAVVCDLVGDSVGDCAGMSADLLGSLAEASSALLVLTAHAPDLFDHVSAMLFPMIVMATGVLVCYACSLVVTHAQSITCVDDVEPAIKNNLVLSTLLMLPVSMLLSRLCFPVSFAFGDSMQIRRVDVALCLCCGLLCALVVGLQTDYWTSHRFAPTQHLAQSTTVSGAFAVSNGISLGFKSTVIPVLAIALTTFVCFGRAGYFGIGLAALGVLSTLPLQLTVDAFGPIADNAGGLAEMARLPDVVRVRTDALDAAGNTAAAVGKGFALASAAFVNMALTGAFVHSVGITSVDLLTPWPVLGLLLGAMLPFLFAALLSDAVVKGSSAMVAEVRDQLLPYLTQYSPLSGTAAVASAAPAKHDDDDDDSELGLSRQQSSEAKHAEEELPPQPPVSIASIESRLVDFEPNYERCVEISTWASLRGMVVPSLLVICTPLLVGFLLNNECLAGVLIGLLLSGVPLATALNTMGGAFDNAKKYVEANLLRDADGAPLSARAYSRAKNVAVMADQIGDITKDVSGPSLNIVLKLTAITSLVACIAFPAQGVLLRLAELL